MSAMGYREALQWLLDNDDCSWLDEVVGDGHVPSVTASFVADAYRKTTDDVERDLRRRRDPATPASRTRDELFKYNYQVGKAAPVTPSTITHDQIKHLRAALFSIRRKNAWHRSIIKDCAAALADIDDLACHESAARAFNAIFAKEPDDVHAAR